MKKRKIYHKYRFLFIGVVVSLFVFIIILAPAALKCFFPVPYMDIVESAAIDNQIQMTWVYSVMKAESGFRPEVVSGKGAVGLMQITEKTGRWIAEMTGIQDYHTESLKEPEVNIRFGCWYLSYLLDRFDGNLQLALAAYNAGEGTVSRWIESEDIIWKDTEIKNVPYGETENYLVRVNRIYFVYKTLYPELDSW